MTDKAIPEPISMIGQMNYLPCSTCEILYPVTELRREAEGSLICSRCDHPSNRTGVERGYQIPENKTTPPTKRKKK